MILEKTNCRNEDIQKPVGFSLLQIYWQYKFADMLCIC